MRDDHIRQQIKDGHMTTYEVRSNRWHKPELIVYFDNHKPVKIKRKLWESYWDLLDEVEKEKEKG